jgi:hypothetical protein
MLANMASREGATKLTQTRRERVAEERGEPVRTVQRSLLEPNNSLYVNVPKLAIDLLDFNKGDEVDVEIHDDRVVVRRGQDE